MKSVDLFTERGKGKKQIGNRFGFRRIYSLHPLSFSSCSNIRARFNSLQMHAVRLCVGMLCLMHR